MAGGARADRGLAGRVLFSWADMRGAMRWLLDNRPSETTLLVFLVVSGAFAYLGSLARLRLAPDEGPLTEAEWNGALLAGIVFFGLLWPLILYLLALLAHGIARAFGGQGNGHASRAAMAWSVLVASPVGLVAGTAALLLEGQAPAPVKAALGSVGLVAFVYALGMCFGEAHGFRGWAVMLFIVGLLGTLLLVLAALGGG